MATAVNGAGAPGATKESEQPRYIINEIPQSQWPDGIPAVMGAHLMASGAVAPISTSKGPGDGNVPHMFQYHTADSDTNVVQFVDFEGAAKGMVAQVIALSKAAIEEKGAFVLTVSGGSMIKALGKFAGAKGADFSKWWVFFVDERNVPHADDDSTYKGVKASFFDQVDIPKEQIFEIHENLSAAQAAINYEGRMLDVPQSVLPRNGADLPVFDCMLLGTGPDAHIASLFPNSAQLSETQKWVVPVTNSPKPPPERITMTLPVINASKACIFLSCGEGKAEVMQRILECQSLPGALPAQLVRPEQGSVTWIIDLAAAAQLEIADWDNKKTHPRSQV